MHALLHWIDLGKATVDLAVAKGMTSRPQWDEAVRSQYFSTSKVGHLRLTDAGKRRLAEERMAG